MSFDHLSPMLRTVLADEAQHFNPGRAAIEVTEVEAAYWRELVDTPRYTDWPQGRPPVTPRPTFPFDAHPQRVEGA